MSFLLLLLLNIIARAENREPPNLVQQELCEDDIRGLVNETMHDLGLREEYANFVPNDPDVKIFGRLLRIRNHLNSPAMFDILYSAHFVPEITDAIVERVRTEAEFFKEHPNFFDPSVVPAYLILTHLFDRETTPDFDIGMMAYLFRDQIQYSEPPENLPWKPKNLEGQRARFAVLMREDRFRRALAALMENQFFHGLAINYRAKQFILSDIPADFGPIANRLRRNHPYTREKEIAFQFLRAIALLLANSSVKAERETTDPMIPVSVKVDGVAMVNRERFLFALKIYSQDQFPDDTMEDQLVRIRMLDNFIFGTFLPGRLNVYRNALIENGMRLLAPMRARFTEFKISERRRREESAPKPGPLGNIPAVPPPGPPSRPNPEKRRNQKRDDESAPEPVAPREVIARDDDLASFKSKADGGSEDRPLTELQANHIYLLDVPGLVMRQKFIFSEEVIEWLRVIPQGRTYIQSIINGRGRDQLHNGFKVLFIHRRNSGERRVYQLKNKSTDYRVLALFANGAWQLIEATHKNKVTARGKILQPIY